MKILKRLFFLKDRVLLLILALSFFLNIYGLYPNFYLHQKEPQLWKTADRIFYNIVHDFNFDPVFTSGPLKLDTNSTYYLSYSPWIYYLQALVRGGVLGFTYTIHNLTNYDFNSPQAFKSAETFKDFVNPQTTVYLHTLLIWFSRFTTAVLGIVSVYLIYITTSELFKKKEISFLAAASLAVMPLFVRESHYATVDIFQSLFFILALLASSKILKKPTIRSYLLAGLILGFTTAIKYFPIMVVPFLFFHFSKAKWGLFNKNLVATVAAFLAGFIFGNPYLLIHPREIYDIYIFNMNFYSVDQFYNPISLIEKFAPRYLHLFHFKFLINEGILLIPLTLAIIGFISGVKKYTLVTAAISSVVIFNTLFISLYIATVYDYLPLPMLPYLAILIGLGLYTFFLKMKSVKKLKDIYSKLVQIILLVVFAPSLLKDLEADAACSQQINEYQAKDWVEQNIPPGTHLAVQPDVQLKEYWPEVLRSEVNTDFSLAELQQKNVSYLGISEGYLNRFLQWSSDLISPPKEILQNQYPNLVLSELQKRAVLVKDFKKPKLCTNTIISIYKLPDKENEARVTVNNYPFDNPESFSEWELINRHGIDSEAKIIFDIKEGSNKPGSLYYRYQKGGLNKFRHLGTLLYSQPVYSPQIQAIPNKKFTAVAQIRQEKTPLNQMVDGFLRLDFYNKSPDDPPLLTAISPRVKGTDFQKISVTAISPQGTNFIRIGFQSLGAGDFGGFWVDDVGLLIED